MRGDLPRYHYKTLPGRLLMILACAFAVIAFMLWLFNMIWPAPILNGFFYGMKNGEPAVAQRDLIPPGKLTDIAVNDESLFLLYATPGIVNAYDHDGAYQYSILFPYKSNGSASLFAAGNDLYYCNRWNDIWQIRSGVYQQMWEHDAGDDRAKKLEAAEPKHDDTRCIYGNIHYEINGQDVIRTDANGRVTVVVDGPALLGMMEFRIIWWFAVLIAAIALATLLLARWTDQKLQKGA